MTKEAISKYTAIAAKQQQELRFEEFDNTAALKLGNLAVETAQKNYHKPVSVRIDIDGITVFYYLMQGANLGNDWWMKKKLNGCLKTGDSSFMNYLKIAADNREDEFPWSKDEGNYAIVGGCFPLRLQDGSLIGHIMVSGLPHEEDHQLLVDTLSSYLDITVPSILDGGSFD